jgi:elongation factor G
MPMLTPQSLRTIALVGHGASGKTTLAEALLAKAGAIPAAGSVEKGSTVCDFDPLEKTYQHSLNAAVVHLTHRDTRIHLIDTPGLPDFIGRAIGALPAVETAVVVVSAQNGIEMITTRMMQWAQKRELCRMIVINKIDAANIDLPRLLESIQAQKSRRLFFQSFGRLGFFFSGRGASGADRSGGGGR